MYSGGASRNTEISIRQDSPGQASSPDAIAAGDRTELLPGSVARKGMSHEPLKSPFVIPPSSFGGSDWDHGVFVGGAGPHHIRLGGVGILGLGEA